MVEWRLVAKEERLTGCRRLDHRGHERGVAAGFERQHQVAHAAEPCPSGERKQATFQEIVLVGAEREARVLFQGLPEKIVVKRRQTKVSNQASSFTTRDRAQID